MYLAEVAEGTPRVLKQYMKIFDSPSAHEPDYTLKLQSAPVTPTKYETHSDIQFFRLVKTKHHYAYHKSKLVLSSTEENVDHTNSRLSGFEPFNREQLLQRLKTFNALNWHIPSGKNTGVQLNELLCAVNGWTCQSIARNNNVKNHLSCSKCGNELILRFNAEEEQPEYAPFHFDLEDIQAVNLNLKAQYAQQVQALGHQSSCPWTKVLTPINTVYYLTPYIASTNEALIKLHTKTLKSLFDNLAIIQEHAGFLSLLCPKPKLISTYADFCRASNLWLLSRYFNNDKENFGTILSKNCPAWLYCISGMGWDMYTQDFNGQTVLLMICQSCNQRIFLRKSAGPDDSSSGSQEHPKVLTPCEYTAAIPHASSKFSNEYMDEVFEEDEQVIDPYLGHKQWCCQVSDMAGQPYFDYFMNMVASLEEYIGPNGEYLKDRDESLDMDIDACTKHSKRRASFDLQEELERFRKLRKPYFAE